MCITSLIESQTAEDLLRSEAVCDTNLFRGLANSSPTDRITKMPIRTDRNPLTTSVASSMLFSAAFEAKFGIADIRRRSAFCTTSLSDAEEYGYGGGVVDVCPLKSGKMAFNPKVADSIVVSEAIDTALGQVFGDAMHEILDTMEEKFGASYATVNALQSLTQIVTEVIGASGAALLEQFFALVNERYFDEYVITGSRVIPRKPEFRRMEVMLFDAPYYYAIKPEDDEEGTWLDD